MANYAPPEVLEQICQHLATQELKIARFICRSLNPVAQRYLFNEILVRSNLGSFRKLSYISRHPILKHFVHKVLYDGTLLSGVYKAFDEWLGRGIGIIGENEMGAPIYAKGVDDFRDQLLPAELEYHFSQYRYYIESQRRVFSSDQITNWLCDAFRSFQNLEGIGFNPGSAASIVPDLFPTRPQMSWNMLSAVGRETLFEPKAVPSHKERMFMVLALIKAAHVSRVRLKSIQSGMIPWETFGKLEDCSNAYDDMLGRLRQLKLNIAYDLGLFGRPQELDNCARFIGKAMMLQTLHLSLGTPPPRPGIRLSPLTKFRQHWPSLNDLKLGSISTEQTVLQSFLKTHASSLRSLELSDMTLDPEDVDATPNNQSWITMIQFLQEALLLNNIRLDGRLEAGIETWVTHDNEYHRSRDPSFVAIATGECLRDQIESFVLHGGTCPIRFPNANERNTYGDISWRHTTQVVRYAV